MNAVAVHASSMKERNHTYVKREKENQNLGNLTKDNVCSGVIKMCDDFDEFAEEVKDMAIKIRAGVCPIWQCGGELEHLEDRINWQEPDLKCKSCGALWLLQKEDKDAKKTLNFCWVKKITFCIMCPKCNTSSGCYTIDEILLNHKNGEECGNCGAVIPIIGDNIQYAELEVDKDGKII